MIEYAKNRVAELKKANEQLTQQFNANLGAIYELEQLIKKEEEPKPKEDANEQK